MSSRRWANGGLSAAAERAKNFPSELKPYFPRGVEKGDLSYGAAAGVMLGNVGVELSTPIQIFNQFQRAFQLGFVGQRPKGIAVAPGFLKRPPAIEIGRPLADAVDRHKTAA